MQDHQKITISRLTCSGILRCFVLSNLQIYTKYYLKMVNQHPNELLFLTLYLKKLLVAVIEENPEESFCFREAPKDKHFV